MCLCYNAGKRVSYKSNVHMEQLPKTTEQRSRFLIQAALTYAQNGWPVFPLHNKIPFKNSQGYKDATTDEQQIQTWWTLHPTANIG